MNQTIREVLCPSCKIQPICKAYDELKKNPGVLAAMTQCRYYEQGDNAFLHNATVIKLDNIQSTAAEEIKDSRPDRDVLHDASEISRKIHEAANDHMKEPVFVKPDGNISCASCGKPDLPLTACSLCGEMICAECATETLDGKILCPSCYNDDAVETAIPKKLTRAE